MYPTNKLDESADFLQTCAKFFEVARSRTKHAHAQLFAELLDPIGAVADAEVNFQVWANAIEPIYRKATEMGLKQKYADVS